MRLNPFDNLQELLLRGGIAPRHVKRYLRELSEHLADLTEAQRKTGLAETEAAMAARAALGPDAELADAMIRQRDFRSISARFPWLVFGLMPPLTMLLTAFLQIILFITLMHLLGFIGPRNFSLPPLDNPPGRLAAFLAAIGFFGNFIVVPAIALFFVFLAARQRMKLFWPLLSALLVAGLSLHWENAPWAPYPPGLSALSMTYRIADDFRFRFGFTPVFLAPWWQVMAAHGFTLMAQYALILLPSFWLLQMRRRVAA